MKHCPYCGAELADEAQFCLFCMKPLDKKRVIPSLRIARRWLPAAIAVLLCLSLGGGALWAFGGGVPPKDGPDSTDILHGNDVGVTTTTHGSLTDPSQSSVNAIEPADTTADTEANPTTTASTAKTTTTITTAKTTKTTTTTTTTTTRITTAPITTTTVPTSPYPVVSYEYRLYEPTDDYFLFNAPAYTDAVVITGVEKPVEGGIYQIPDTLDGCRVIGIMPDAFSDPAVAPTVRAIVFSKDMRFVHPRAFDACINLTDVYFTRNVSLHYLSFPAADKRGTVTFHCPVDCHDRNFAYYSKVNIHTITFAEWKNFVYEEWGSVS